MAAPATASPSPEIRSFAALLAQLAAPDKKFSPASDFDGLRDDVATLSYEHALRAHARYRPQASQSGQLDTGTAAPAKPRAQTSEPPPAASPGAPTDPQTRKCASVTVRLTRAEDDQLRQRAAEAGLTISAYLRSCALEVETLRAQVKQTVAEMRRAQPQSGHPQADPPPAVQSRGALARLFPWKRRPAAP